MMSSIQITTAMASVFRTERLIFYIAMNTMLNQNLDMTNKKLTGKNNLMTLNQWQMAKDFMRKIKK